MADDAERNHSEGAAIETCLSNGEDRFLLTDDHRMLLQIRDTLYEGSWDDFVTDLRSRSEGRPHVFETLPVSASMKATIAHHLELIEQMQTWERDRGQRLQAGPAP